MKFNGAIHRVEEFPPYESKAESHPSRSPHIPALYGKVCLALALAVSLLSVRFFALHNPQGGLFMASLAVLSSGLACYCWLANRRTSRPHFREFRSAQECADRIIKELCCEGIAFDEEQLAESVATVLLQQSLDLAGFVDAKAELREQNIYQVIGSARRKTGERVEFMGRFHLWWSISGQVRCDSLGLIWS